MAFSIALGITQNSYNESSKTSSVTVTYTLKWSGGTWNWEAPGAGVDIEGVGSYTFAPKLNPRKTNSGSEQVWSKTVDVSHGSGGDKTLKVSAYYNWRGVTKSASKTLSTNVGGGSSSSSTNITSKAVITKLEVQSGTERTLYATWTWDQSNTEHYEVEWYYDTGDGVWFIGSDTTVDKKQSTYTAPDNALKVKLQVKPISKKHTVNNQEVSYWTACWSTAEEFNLSDTPPLVPPVPIVEITDDVLHAFLDNLDVNGDKIEFQVVKDNSSIFNTGTASIITSSASYSCEVSKNSKYKVRCRTCKGNEYSKWSEYSENINSSPSAPSAITVCKASSETSVYLEWVAVPDITTYDIEYTTKKEYFDGSDATTVISNVEFTHYEKTGLTTGSEYFFRVRAVDDNIHSEWSEIKSVTIGSDPAAPTTWSSTTVASIGDIVNLYWVHNAEDGSSQTYGELELYINNAKETYTIKNSTDEDEKDKTSVYSIDTSTFTGDVEIKWRVRTAGVTLAYGDWSVQRTVDIYAKPTLEFGVTDIDGELIDTLTSFPFYVSALAGPETQAPIGYHITVTANDAYETVDVTGNLKIVNQGEEVYSKHFDTSDVLLVEISANNIDLENNISYTVTCAVYMDSGLDAVASSDMLVAWTDIAYEPNAEIGVNIDTLTASIRPYCVDANNQPVADVMLSVYRRDFDGTFTELAKNLDNARNTFITDPHPALDHARYRIVAITRSTGAVSYYDVTTPVGGTAVVIQWNETWSNFDIINQDRQSQATWSGSMLKLPYNIDVADSNSADVSLIGYIGRKHPVAYYGTQLGSASTWNVAIPKNDKETLYALRRLAAWMGDVYVREPSASGYWAKISVSFSQKHKDLTIPVTMNITRVEGGA